MSRTPTRYTQAELARANRAMKQVFGHASVVFETDGRVRILSGEGRGVVLEPRRENTPALSFAPPIPKPQRQFSSFDLRELKAKFPYRSREEMARLPSLPFHRRESDALEQLLRHGLQVPVPLEHLRQCGSDTPEKLYIRGHVEAGFYKEAPSVIMTIAINEAGLQAIKPKPIRP